MKDRAAVLEPCFGVGHIMPVIGGIIAVPSLAKWDILAPVLLRGT